MEKPRGFIHWTNDHSYFDEAGLVVIGRLRIPVAYLLAVYGVVAVVLFSIGFAQAAGLDVNNDNIRGNGDVSTMYPFFYSLLVPAFVGVSLLISLFVRWTVWAFKRANRD